MNTPAENNKPLSRRLQKAIADVASAYDAWCRASCMQMMAPPNDPVRPDSDALLAKAVRVLNLAQARQFRVMCEVCKVLEEDNR